MERNAFLPWTTWSSKGAASGPRRHGPAGRPGRPDACSGSLTSQADAGGRIPDPKSGQEGWTGQSFVLRVQRATLPAGREGDGQVGKDILPPLAPTSQIDQEWQSAGMAECARAPLTAGFQVVVARQEMSWGGRGACFSLKTNYISGPCCQLAMLFPTQLLPKPTHSTDSTPLLSSPTACSAASPFPAPSRIHSQTEEGLHP